MRWKLSVAAFVVGALTLAVTGLALGQSGDPERGGKLFAENCAVCHGADGRGRIGATLNEEWSGVNVNAFLRQTIATGINGTRMPAWGQQYGGPLSDQDIEDIAAYVEALSGGTEPVYPAPTIAPQAIVTLAGVSGDPSRGAIIFGQNCVVCHGEKGQGRIGATLAKNWPAILPGPLIHATIERGVDGSVMPAWSVDYGGPLTHEEIDDVTAFVLSLEPVLALTPAPAPSGPISLTTGLIGLGLILLVVVGVLVAYYRRK